jgi:GTP-binding protein EngB required for normal cell division
VEHGSHFEKRAFDLMDPQVSCPGQNCYLFVGNPGTGKSTLINGFLGEAKMEARSSLDGAGVTAELHSLDVPGLGKFMDTPGLADEAMKEKAAAAITEALKQNGYYRIFFVMTVEAGRCRPADKATMRLILEAAPVTDYSIIVNKVSKKWVRDMMTGEDEDGVSFMKKWTTLLMQGLKPVTVSIHFMLKDSALDDEENVLFRAPEDIIEFIKNAPGMKIDKDEVKDVEASEIAKVEKQFQDDIRALEEDKNKMKAEMEEQRKLMADAVRRADQAKQEAARAAKAADDAKAAQERAETAAREERNKPPPPPPQGGGADFGRIFAGIFSFGLSELAHK